MQEQILAKFDCLMISIPKIQMLIKQQHQFCDELKSSSSHQSTHAQCKFISNLFIKFSSHFYLYSIFCAAHSRATQLNHSELQPKLGIIDGSIESVDQLLIKPIQRILKYPLLLTQMQIYSNEQLEAIKELDKINVYINEMQRINEEYGAIFEYLIRSHYKQTQQLIDDFSLVSLLYYGGVDWLNAQDFLGHKMSAKLELHSMVFVFKNCVVFLCKEIMRHKKKLIEIIRHQQLIPVNELQVRNVNSNEWHVIHLKLNGVKKSEKIYKLMNSKCELKMNFLKEIRSIIRQSVAQMNYKQTKQTQDGGSIESTATTSTSTQSDNQWYH